MFLIFDNIAIVYPQSKVRRYLRFSVPTTLYLQDMRISAEFLISLTDILRPLTLYIYDYVPKSNLKRQYVLNNGLWSTFNSLYHLLIKSLITFERQCLLNSFMLPPIVTPRESTISSILDTQVLKPR